MSRTILVLFFTILTYSASAQAKDLENSAIKRQSIINDEKTLWYAVVKVDGGKRKLHTKGDIFYSVLDITKCLRIVDIKKDVIILEDITSSKNIVVEVGMRIPVEGTEIIFEKTIRAETI